MRIKVLLLMCCICSCFMATRVYGQIIIVSSSADSGPGSLREAIEECTGNGNLVTDYIHLISRRRYSTSGLLILPVRFHHCLLI